MSMETSITDLRCLFIHLDSHGIYRTPFLHLFFLDIVVRPITSFFCNLIFCIFFINQGDIHNNFICMFI